MRSSNNRTAPLSFHDDNYRQRRRRKEQPLSKCSPQHQHQWIIVFLSSVWVLSLHCYIHQVESGYISSRYRSICPSNCRSHDQVCTLDQSRYNIAVQRFLPPNQQHHLAMRSFGVSQKSVSNDRNSDQDDNNDNNKNNSADQILRNMGGFVPFFATQSSQPQPSPESDTSKSAFWGVSEWFRRDTQNKTNDTTSSKKIEAKSIKKKSKVETTTTNRLEAPLPLSKLQDLFSFNSTKSPDKKDNAMLSTRSNGGKNNQGNSTTSTGNYNPLSVFQKFFATPLFQSTTISEEETWYPVFPKTRIMPGEMVPVSVMGIDLLVIASIDGRSLYCIANSCPHLGTPLETGRLTRLPIESQSISSISSSSIPTTDSLLTAAATTSATPNDDNNNNNNINNNNNNGIIFTETDIANILSQDGCEDCIICPLHRTAFALTSGEVRGEWCPYPPIIGALMGTVKEPTSAAVFQVRTRGKNIEVRLNSVLPPVRESS